MYVCIYIYIYIYYNMCVYIYVYIYIYIYIYMYISHASITCFWGKESQQVLATMRPPTTRTVKKLRYGFIKFNRIIYIYIYMYTQ